MEMAKGAEVNPTPPDHQTPATAGVAPGQTAHRLPMEAQMLTTTVTMATANLRPMMDQPKGVMMETPSLPVLHPRREDGSTSAVSTTSLDEPSTATPMTGTPAT